MTVIRFVVYHRSGWIIAGGIGGLLFLLLPTPVSADCGFNLDCQKLQSFFDGAVGFASFFWLITRWLLLGALVLVLLRDLLSFSLFPMIGQLFQTSAPGLWATLIVLGVVLGIIVFALHPLLPGLGTRWTVTTAVPFLRRGFVSALLIGYLVTHSSEGLLLGLDEAVRAVTTTIADVGLEMVTTPLSVEGFQPQPTDRIPPPPRLYRTNTCMPAQTWILGTTINAMDVTAAIAVADEYDIACPDQRLASYALPRRYITGDREIGMIGFFANAPKNLATTAEQQEASDLAWIGAWRMMLAPIFALIAVCEQIVLFFFTASVLWVIILLIVASFLELFPFVTGLIETTILASVRLFVRMTMALVIIYGFIVVLALLLPAFGLVGTAFMSIVAAVISLRTTWRSTTVMVTSLVSMSSTIAQGASTISASALGVTGESGYLPYAADPFIAPVRSTAQFVRSFWEPPPPPLLPPPTGTQASTQIGPQASTQAGVPTRAQAGPQASTQIGPQASTQIGPQASAQAGTQASAQAGPQASAQAGPQAKKSSKKQRGATETPAWHQNIESRAATLSPETIPERNPIDLRTISSRGTEAINHLYFTTPSTDVLTQYVEPITKWWTDAQDALDRLNTQRGHLTLGQVEDLVATVERSTLAISVAADDPSLPASLQETLRELRSLSERAVATAYELARNHLAATAESSQRNTF